jgi:hypothetical protein
MTYQECRELLFNRKESERFTREWCETQIVESKLNNGRGIPSRTWNALLNNHLLKDNGDNTFSFFKSEKKSERQCHGFQFENFVKEKFNVQPCPKGHYTYKWDGMLENYPVSIKTEALGSDIEMSSFIRNAYNTDDFYLIVGFWEGKKNNIVKIETLFISGTEWHELFDQDLVQECQEFLRYITNDVSDDDKWKAGRMDLTKRWQEKTPNLVRPRFKRDHKTQKRMQCAINYFDFYNYFIPKYGKEI